MGDTDLLFVAVDIGGTFTDLVAFDQAQHRLYSAKRLTTPGNLVDGILNCVQASGLALSDAAQLIHGSTVSINTLIERKGAKTALLVTKGTRDVYAIGRGNRPDAYNLFFSRPKPLAPRAAIYEIDERMLAGGHVRTPLDPAEIEAVAKEIAEEGYEAVAVCFLHSYANVSHEERASAILRSRLNGRYVTASHEIMREYREYERISTTAVNAYIGPKVSGYVGSLEGSLRDNGFRGELSIMQSNGGVMSPQIAAKRPVMMMESGPVGGIIACAQVASALGYANSISFDMGGTTAKASLVRDAMPAMAEGYYVGGYEAGDPVMIPVVDVVEVGTGGGSIAWLDEVGALKVGPRSAGSSPGPICYGLGGEQPTITDANVALGRLDPTTFLGGEMKLDLDAARRGIEEKIAKPLGISADAAARAIVDIAIAKMSLAVRQVSVEKGYDPRDFALVASGGAGPLHAVAIARELNIPTVVIPWFPSHFSALGMLLADERHDAVRTFPAPLDTLDFAALGGAVAELEADLRAMARQSGAQIEIFLDLRYVGQEFNLSIPVTPAQIAQQDRTGIRAAFDELHKARYEHNAENEPVEMINVRLIARAPRAKPNMPSPGGSSTPARKRDAIMHAGPPVACDVYERANLAAGAMIQGPALIQEYGSTTVVFPGDRCEVAATGELVIHLAK
jgi:N-methylhydantoinase A